MKKHVIFFIVLMLFVGCSDSIQNEVAPPENQSNQFQISFSLQNASANIVAVTGVLESLTHPTINFNMTLDGQMASHVLDDVLAGQWTLTIRAYDDLGQTVNDLKFIGSKTVEIVPGQLTSVGITLNPTSGALQFLVAWGSSASVALDINITGANASIQHYQYELTRSGFASIHGSLNKANAVSNHITASIHDIQHGVWKMTITGVSTTLNPIVLGSANIEMLTGIITQVDVAYVAGSPATLQLTESFDTESGLSHKVYVGDETFRQYLIIEKGFSDLREPYILRSEAESVKILGLNRTDINQLAIPRKNLNRYLNLESLSAFTGLVEFEATDWIASPINFLNHPDLKHVELTLIETEHVDFSGAQNLLALGLQNVSIFWVDIDDITNLEDLHIEYGEGPCCQLEFKFQGANFGHNIGSVYANANQFNQYDVDESKFVTSDFDTDSAKVKLPDTDAKRALFAYNFIILKDDYVLQSETEQFDDFTYYDFNNYYEKGIFPGLNTYRALESVEVLKILPNLRYVWLEDQKFTEIDLSNNPELYQIVVIECQFFSEIDLSNNTGLGDYGEVKSRHNKSFPGEINIENNFSLTSIIFGNQTHSPRTLINQNSSLTSLDFSTVSGFSELYANDNTNLTSVNLSGTYSQASIQLQNNNLTSLNVGGAYIYNLHLENNAFTSLDLTAADSITTVYVNGNLLTSLTVSGLKTLTSLYANDNNLTSIDLTNLSTLSYLYLSNNDLQPSIDISTISNPLGQVNTQGLNLSLNTIFYAAGQDTTQILHDSITTLVQVPSSKGGF